MPPRCAAASRRGPAGSIARPEASQENARRHINPFLYLLCVLVVSALLAGTGWLLASDLCAFSRDIPSTTKISVEVTAEDDIGSIAEKLQNAGLIKYKWFFSLFRQRHRRRGGDRHRHLHPEYRYGLPRPDRRDAQPLRQPQRGRPSPSPFRRATLSGRPSPCWREKGVNTEEALTEAAQTGDFDYDFIDSDSEDITRLEGYLFPDTYEFYVGHNPEDALDRLLRNFVSRMDEDRMAQVEASGRSLHEIITIASLIEEETDGTDQANIASVIYNRLEGPR